MFQFSPSCSHDHIRIRADMRILPSAITNISLKTRKIILGGNRRLAKKNMHSLTKHGPLRTGPDTGAQLAPVSRWAQSQFQIFSVMLISRYFGFLVLFTLKKEKKKKQQLHLKNSRSKIYGTCLWCFMKYFPGLCCPGNVRIQLKSESPFSWRISPQGTINLQPLFKDCDGLSSVRLANALLNELTSGSTQRALFEVREHLAPDKSRNVYFCMFLKSIHSIVIRNFWQL